MESNEGLEALLCRARGARLGAGPMLCRVVSSRLAGTRVCGCVLLLPGLTSSNGICNITNLLQAPCQTALSNALAVADPGASNTPQPFHNHQCFVPMMH